MKVRSDELIQDSLSLHDPGEHNREEDIMSTTAAVKALEGDWQFVSEKVLLALACKVMLSTAGLGSSEGDSEAHDGQ